VAGYLDGQAGHRHQCPGEVGMGLGPDEAVHAAHRGAHQKPQAGDSEPLDQHPPLRLDHVVIIVCREAHPHPVARLRRPAVAEIVGENDVIAGEVERLARAEQLAGELRLEELAAAAAGAVEDHHRIVDPASCIPPRRSQGGVMHPDFRQPLARAEAEVAQHRVAFGEAASIILSGRGAGRQKHRRRDQHPPERHLDLPGPRVFTPARRQCSMARQLTEE
jgi:hypothetical protein